MNHEPLPEHLMLKLSTETIARMHGGLGGERLAEFIHEAIDEKCRQITPSEPAAVKSAKAKVSGLPLKSDPS
jgi:hypothetical protein